MNLRDKLVTHFETIFSLDLSEKLSYRDYVLFRDKIVKMIDIILNEDYSDDDIVIEGEMTEKYTTCGNCKMWDFACVEIDGTPLLEYIDNHMGFDVRITIHNIDKCR